MKARDWLVSQGLAKTGRGKFSNVAKAALADAIADGTKFSDYGDEHVTEEVGYETPAMTWPDGTARFKETGKKVSMKNACNSCGHSLYWCECPRPTIYMKEVVISTN